MKQGIRSTQARLVQAVLRGREERGDNTLPFAQFVLLPVSASDSSTSKAAPEDTDRTRRGTRREEGWQRT